MSAGRYQRLVQPIADSIAPALVACASSGLYFQATSPADIASAFSAIYANATRTVRNSPSSAILVSEVRAASACQRLTGGDPIENKGDGIYLDDDERYVVRASS